MNPSLPIAILTCCALAQAGNPVFTSTYTDSKSCKMFDTCDKDPEHCGDGYQECPGPGKFYVLETYSAVSTWRSVKLRGTDGWDVQLVPSKTGAMQNYGSKTEWRHANGVPFAVIQRTKECDSEDGKRCDEYLVVRGLRGYESISADIDTRKTPDANTAARKAADDGFTKSKH